MNPTRLKLIVGLGNPGPRFSGTRHNIGFAVLDAFAVQAGLAFQTKNNAEIAHGANFILLKPLTFMNNSGDVVAPVAKKGITSEEILVVHDELEVAVGQIKLRLGGSARGHNGLKSIIQRLGTDAFWRMRCGIGRPERKEDVPDYVLARFTSTEQQNAHSMIQAACDLLTNFLS